MVRRATTVGVAGLITCLAVLAGGCTDNNLVTGPTPAGVTTAGSALASPEPSTAPSNASSPSSVPATAAGGSGGAAAVTGVELSVRQAAGGCWEVLAPGAPAGVTRQDLWFPSAEECEGPAWSIALRIYASPAASAAAGQEPAPGAVRYRDGTALVLLTKGVPAAVRSAVASVPGLVPVPVS